MTIAAALADHGIRLSGYRIGEHRSICPQCSATRRKATDPCLAVKIDEDGGATWTCHHCQWTGNVPGESARRDRGIASPREPARRIRPSPVAPDPNPDRPESMYDWFTSRGIGRATVDAMGCYVAGHFMPQTGREERCVVFPYLLGGELVNRKYRTRDKQFAQDKGAARTLYNIDALAGHDTAIIVEGEMDVLACIEAGVANVISLPDGAPAKVKDEIDPADRRFEALATCDAELSGVTKFVIAADADAPGTALAEELARRLGKERCWRVRWPELHDAPRKDANEVLQLDGAEVLRECVAAAEPWPVSGLYAAADYADAVLALYQHGHGRGLSTGWPAVDALYTVRPGDLSIVTGIPNSGKSEWIDALMVNMARLHGWRFAVCSFENSPAEHVAKMAEKYIHAPFFDGPTPRMDERMLRSAIGWATDHFTFIRADDDAPTIDWILDRARVAVRRNGVRGLVIDPWNEIEHKRSTGLNETEYVSQALGRVRRFAQVCGVHVWFVAHPAKMYRDGGVMPVPSLYDISGSAHWANKADFGIVVHRPDDTTPITEVHLRKVRHKWLGKKGVVQLRYAPATGEYSAALA